MTGLKQAVLIQCHKNPEQVNLLLEALCGPDVDVYIHVDRKSDMIRQLKSFPNAFLLPDELRVDVKWAGFSQIRATLNLLDYASSHGIYEHYWLISGQDYPIKPIPLAVSFLNDHPNTNFVQIWPSNNGLGSENHGPVDWRVEKYFLSFMMGPKLPERILKRAWVEITGGYGHTWQLFRRRGPENIRFYFGSQWICITDEFRKWMTEYLSKHPDFSRYFMHVVIPDETFFQTLIMNSPYRNTRSDFLHYIDWSKGGNNPKILGKEDFEALQASDKFMARKFDINVDAEIIRLLNEQVLK